MINGSLPEIFGSFSIGVFFTLLTIYFIHEVLLLFFCKRRRYEMSGIFQILSKLKDSSKIIEAFTVLIISILIYSTGILIEDITDHLTDSNTKTPFWSYTEDLDLLPSEGDLRIKTLLIEENNKVSINELGKRYFFDENKLKNAKKDLKINNPLIDSLIITPEITLSNYSSIDSMEIRKDVENIVNYLYYDAKNWCYTQTTHFQELEFIQNRIDFSRSCFLIAFFFVILFCLLFVWGLRNKLFHLYKITADKKNLLKPLEDKNEENRLKNKYQRYLRNFSKKNSFNNWIIKKNMICIFVLLIVLLVSYNSYQIAEFNFNERAFGYFLSK